MRTKFLASGHVEMTLGCSIYATSALLIRFIDLPASVIVFFRFSLAALALLLYGLPFRRLYRVSTRRDWWLLATIGSISVLSFVTFVLALQYTSVANTSLLFFISPVVTPFLAHKLLNEEIRANAVVALLLAIVGVFFVGYPKLGSTTGRDIIGMVLAFSGGCVASSATVLRKMIAESVPSYVITLYQYLVATLATVPLLLLVGSSYAITPLYLLFLAILGIFNTGLGGLMTNDSMGKITAQDATVLRYAEPVGAILLAWLFLAEVPSLATMFGGALILVAGYLVIRTPEPARSG